VKAHSAAGGRFIPCVLTPTRKRWAIVPPRPGSRKLLSAAMVMTDVHSSDVADVHSSDVAAADEPAGARPSWELHRVGNLAGHTSRVFCTAFSPRCVAHLRTEPALEATQGQNDRFLSQLPYKCYLEEVASVGD